MQTNDEMPESTDVETEKDTGAPTDETLIGIKKSGDVLGFIGCLAFAICGVALLGENPLAAFCTIGFFGLGAIVFWKRANDNRPGLRLNSKGFEFPVSGVVPGQVHKFGLIPWSDVESCVTDEIRIEEEGEHERKAKIIDNKIQIVEEVEYTAHEYLLIILHDPGAYLSKLGVFSRVGAVTKCVEYSSPVAIPKKSKLKIKFADLCELFERYHSNYGPFSF